MTWSVKYLSKFGKHHSHARVVSFFSSQTDHLLSGKCSKSADHFRLNRLHGTKSTKFAEKIQPKKTKPTEKKNNNLRFVQTKCEFSFATYTV